MSGSRADLLYPWPKLLSGELERLWLPIREGETPKQCRNRVSSSARSWVTRRHPESGVRVRFVRVGCWVAFYPLGQDPPQLPKRPPEGVATPKRVRRPTSAPKPRRPALGYHRVRPELYPLTLATLMRRVRPTSEELERIEAACERWGKADPSMLDLLDDVRPGILSIASIMAQGVRPPAAAEVA